MDQADPLEFQRLEKMSQIFPTLACPPFFPNWPPHPGTRDGPRGRRGKSAAVRLLMIAVALAPLCAAGYDASSAQGDVRQAQAMTEQVPWSQLLGPLAPIALSPFFGLACLSALSIVPGNCPVMRMRS